ncbi:MAG: septum site-determining protein MinC [Anaerolineae bacterium]|nr:septum site-determining protein MinC [Anaerolineae bacterium]MBN8619529.1 septum site-determining protein MinC [Anaerolineae bacterium]
MQEQTVAIKGIKDGLLISLSPTEEWQSITADLAARIDQQSAFFAGARITIDLGERPVPKHELSSLKALLERRGLALYTVLSESATTVDAALALDLRTTTSTPIPGREDTEDDEFDPEEDGTVGVMIKRTLRSGRTVNSAGHVVVLGDVNPGAKIIAVGDIIVWGRLRGIVHAGAEGDEQALVCALDMSPMQLRIAGYITTSPPEKRRQSKPEIASVRKGQIVVEPWSY